METMHYSLNEFGSSVLNLGRCGESGVRCVEIELQEWMDEYPQACVQLIVRQPGTDGYLAATVLDDGLLRWEIDRANTAQEGFGKAELMLIGDGGECKKSATADIYVGPSLSTELEAEPPSPMLPWLAQMAEYASSVTAGARETAALTQESRELCGQSGQAAQEAAQAAQTAAEAAQTAEKTLNEIVTAGQEADNRVRIEGEAQCRAVGAAGSEQVQLLEQQADSRIAEIDNAGASQVDAVAQAGAEAVCLSEGWAQSAQESAAQASRTLEGLSSAAQDAQRAIDATGDAQVSAVVSAGKEQAARVADQADSEIAALVSEAVSQKEAMSALSAQAGAYAGAAEESASRSMESAEAAQEAEQQARAFAQQAQQGAINAGYVAFEIDENGQLVYSKTASLELTFELDEGVLIAHG